MTEARDDLECGGHAAALLAPAAGIHPRIDALRVARAALCGGLVGGLIAAAPAPAQALCSGGSKPTGFACGAIPVEGCCDGTTLLFCEGGELCSLPCEKTPTCGWNDDKGLYECGTGGGGEPSGALPHDCPPPLPAVCLGIDYEGCCDGEVVRWCDGTALHHFDCSDNSELSACGFNQAKGTADCVAAASGAAASPCPTMPAGDDVSVQPDSGEAESAASPDVAVTLDGLTVPDLHGPSSCSTLAPRYSVASTTCQGFGGYFLVLQEGCAALLAGLTPGASSHPGALVTKSGLAFEASLAGKVWSCTGQFQGAGVAGSCQRVEGAESCAFSFVEEAPPPEEEGGGGGSGGCSAGPGPGPGAAPGLGLSLGLLWLAWLLRQARRMRSVQSGKLTATCGR